MIYDTLSGVERYRAVHPLFDECFAYLRSQPLAELSTGRYPIGGAGAHALISEYETKPEESLIIECHRRFIDIQYTISGEERIGVVARTLCSGSAYDVSRDFEQLIGRPDFLTLIPGLFAVFFPEDGHAPGIACGQSNTRVKKLVIKVPVKENQ